MDSLNFNLSFHQRKYQIFIDWGVAHKFKNKHQADLFVRKFKSVIHDNVLIMGNIYNQLMTLRNVYARYFNSETTRKLKICVDDFEDSYYWIYHNWSPDSHVQFNQIRVSFDNLVSFINILKKDAQVNKRGVLLSNIYPIEKILYLILDAYRSDIRGLTDGFSYRTKEIKLKPFNDVKTTRNNSKSNVS